MKIKRWYTVFFPSPDGKMCIEKRKKKAHAYSLALKQSVSCVVCCWEQSGSSITCVDIDVVHPK